MYVLCTDTDIQAIVDDERLVDQYKQKVDHGATAEQVETLRYRTFTDEDTRILPMSYKGVNRYNRGQEEEEGSEGGGRAEAMAKDKSSVNKYGRPLRSAAASGKRNADSDESSLGGDSLWEVEDKMELTDDTTTDDQGGRGSAKAGSSKGKAEVKAKVKDKDYKGKEAQVGGAVGSSSRPKRAATVKAKYTDDDDDFEVGAGGDVSDEY